MVVVILVITHVCLVVWFELLRSCYSICNTSLLDRRLVMQIYILFPLKNMIFFYYYINKKNLFTFASLLLNIILIFKDTSIDYLILRSQLKGLKKFKRFVYESLFLVKFYEFTPCTLIYNLFNIFLYFFWSFLVSHDPLYSSPLHGIKGQVIKMYYWILYFSRVNLL